MGSSVYRTPAERERVPRHRQSFGEVALVLLLGGVAIAGVHLALHPERPGEPRGPLREARHTLARGYGGRFEPPPFALPPASPPVEPVRSDVRGGAAAPRAGWRPETGPAYASVAIHPMHNEVPYQTPALQVQAPSSHFEAPHYAPPSSNNSSSYLSHGTSTSWSSPSGGHFGKGH